MIKDIFTEINQRFQQVEEKIKNNYKHTTIYEYFLAREVNDTFSTISAHFITDMKISHGQNYCDEVILETEVITFVFSKTSVKREDRKETITLIPNDKYTNNKAEVLAALNFLCVKHGMENEMETIAQILQLKVYN